MLNCLECRRLEDLLERPAVTYYELAQRVLLLDDSDPEKTWAGMALRGAKEYKDEVSSNSMSTRKSTRRLVSRLFLFEFRRASAAYIGVGPALALAVIWFKALLTY